MSNTTIPLLKPIPDGWGPKFESMSGSVTHTQIGPSSISFNAPSHMALMLFTPQQSRELSLNTDRKSVFSAPVGTMEIVPFRSALSARWGESKESLLIALSPGRMAQLAGLEFQREDFELLPLAAGHVDQKALMLAHSMRGELQDRRQPNHLYLDSLLVVFSTHLLRNYSTLRDRPSPRPRGGLSPKARRDVEDYIRTNISKGLSINLLAQVTELSPSHFLRAFKQSVGQAPHQYVLAIRVEQAERLIVTTDMPLSEIAKVTGFASHSHMTSTMRRNKLTTPSNLRRTGIA